MVAVVESEPEQVVEEPDAVMVEVLVNAKPVGVKLPVKLSEIENVVPGTVASLYVSEPFIIAPPFLSVFPVGLTMVSRVIPAGGVELSRTVTALPF